jgi:N-acetylglucosamine kinase-like BadF-type ATPase
LGDEGSGAVLGKKLVADVLKNQLPDAIRSDFYSTYPLTPAEIIDKVYRQPFPNRFLAQFVPFIFNHITHPDMEKMVKSGFVAFIERNIFQYQKAGGLPVHFTGSVAYCFKNILAEVCSQMNLRLGKVTKEPLPDLIEYHLKNK